MKSLLLAIITLFPLAGFTQHVHFESPTDPWKRSPAQIEETSIDIYPKGNFAEVELFISFSSTNPGEFADEEFIEMISYFNLHEDVAVSDLWLWFGDEILKAHIIDRWSANRIYEDIVNRQKDPAIIYKNSPKDYELRIYPFLPSQTRKIKLSFLIPVDITENIRSFKIPNFYHQAINTINTNPTLRYWTEENSPEINIKEIDGLDFNAGVDSTGKKYWSSEIDWQEFKQGSITLTKEESIPDVSLTTYVDSANNEQYFSFSLIPKNILEIDVSKKLAVVFDVALSNTTSSMDDLKIMLGSYLKDNFDETDKFNLFYSNLSAQRASETWLSGSDTVIDSVLNSIENGDISGFSNLDDLLASSIDFIEEMEDKGEILLISSSDTYINFQDANAFAESIFEYTDGNLPQMTIIDIQDDDIESRWANGSGIYYQGNEYLYNILAIESGGDLFNYNDAYEISERMMLGFERLEGVISDYDIYSTFSSGFSYSRFNNRSISKLPLNSTFIQIGKYYGELPLTIQFSGTFADTVFNQQLVINEGTLDDGTLKRFWVANKIHEMESSFPTNEDISEIIDYSIDNRIMSQYTSFLALEPGDSALIDQETLTNGGGTITNTEDEDNPESFRLDTLKAYPNPFNPSVNIEVQLSEGWDASASSIIIYNILGQQVAVLETSQYQGQTSFTVNWDISQFKGELSTGLYLVRVVTPYTSKYIKITYLK